MRVGWLSSAIELRYRCLLPYHLRLKDLVMTEFVGLARRDLDTEVANVIAGPGWSIRHLLVSRLKDVGNIIAGPSQDCSMLRGLDDVAVPGVELGPLRPWR